MSEDVIYTINYEDVKKAILQLKESLIEKGEASDIFGNEKDKSFEGVLGSISQTVFGRLAFSIFYDRRASRTITLLYNKRPCF